MENLNRITEQRIWQAALCFLEHGRQNWDIPHTQATVFWMRQLLHQESGNEKILVTTMYLHDIGIVPHDPAQIGLAYQLAQKEKHMEYGARNAENILNGIPDFTDAERKEIIYLVSIHDDLSKIKSANAQLVFEADCLGQIDRSRVKSTMSPEESIKFIHYFKQKRLPLFKTNSGIRFAEQLLNRIPLQ